MVDIIGKTFGNLVVVSYSHTEGSHQLYNCNCACGKTTIVRKWNLLTGNTKSCGCLWRKVKNIEGQRFGRLLVVEYSHTTSNGVSFWRCMCDCGNESIVRKSQLTTGVTKSCGCYGHEQRKKATTKHAMSETVEYSTWKHIKARCNNPNSDEYKHYGGRGIVVCDSWLESFDNFYKDMGNRHDGTSIDRIDNNGNYEPNNCRWATSAQQNRNTNRNRNVTINTKTQCLKDWCDFYGMPYTQVLVRINKLKWSIIDALTIPIKHKQTKIA